MSTSCRTPFVGVGTGRCGTVSLSRIVDACHNTRVSHEKYQLHWYEVNEHLGQMIKDFREGGKSGVLCGDISPPHIRHIGEIRSSFRDMPVVCMHRDKSDSVRSLVEYGCAWLRPSDKRKWADGCQKNGIRANVQKCFPMIDAVTVKQSYEFYWELYEELMSRIRDPVLHLDVNDLNDDSKLDTLFDFLGIGASDRVYIEKRRWWSNEVVQVERKEFGFARER